MNLETLHLYCEIVRVHSFSRGAAENGVSQSAASQAVQQLESELHVQLLDRSKRPFALTPEGRKFYEACRTLLQNFERTRAEISQARQELEGTVRVAAIYSVGLHGISGQMQRFLSLHPKTRVRLECLHPRRVVETVVQDEADIGVLSYPPANRALSVVPLRSDPIVFVCPPHHRLARRRTLAATDLNGEPFVAFDADLSIRKAIDRALRKRNAKAQVVMEFDNVETIKQAIINGAGVSLLPAPTIVKEVGIRTLSAVPLNIPELTRPVAAIHRRNKLLTPAVARFLATLQEVDFQPDHTPGTRH
ncbi:MAG: LysR family transcriptional regulator [Acidobacteria bacterium]|nr:LysR family transcriptional regulator [Acidobacteriota bacterium]